MKHVLLLIMTLGFLFVSCQKEAIEPEVFTGKPTQQQTPESTPPPAPTKPNKNCEVTIKNNSTNPAAFLHVYLNGKAPNDLLICTISPGETAKVCLKMGNHTLYGFTNMYQFTGAIKVKIEDAESMTIGIRSGP